MKPLQENIPFFEVYVNTPIEICEARDPKSSSLFIPAPSPYTVVTNSGLYKKARFGEIRGFTGIDSIYETPSKPDLVVNAGSESECESTQRVLQFLHEHKIIPDAAMRQLCAPPVRELFVEAAEVGEVVAREGPIIELSLVDLQWTQVGACVRAVAGRC